MTDLDLQEIGLQSNDPINLETLEIHKLTQAQYNTLLEHNLINENAIYMTPNEALDVSNFATVDQVDGKAEKEHAHIIDDVGKLQETLDAMDLEIKAKAEKNDTYTKEEVGGLFTAHEDGHAPSDAEANVIAGIKLNDQVLKPNNKIVEINCVVSSDIENLAEKSTTLEGYGITDAYTKDEVNVLLSSVAYISTEEDENIVFTDEINQQIILAVNTALANAKATGQFDGRDGKTPIAGEDYFTVSEKNEMIEAVFARIPNGNEVAY